MLTIVGQLAELTAKTCGNVILDGLHRARRRLAEFVDLATDACARVTTTLGREQQRGSGTDHQARAEVGEVFCEVAAVASQTDTTQHGIGVDTLNGASDPARENGATYGKEKLGFHL
jgi:hypothetical protein